MGCGCGASSSGNCKKKNKKLTVVRNRLRTLLISITNTELRAQYSQKIVEMDSVLAVEKACVDTEILRYFTNYVNNEYSKYSGHK